MKIGILFQDVNVPSILWQKNSKLYSRTPRRAVEMANALIRAGYEVIIYSSLKDFLNKVFMDSVDLVFPCIECCFERNTNGFIPSILQMKNIPFIGNDSYINTIASDKYLFKNIAISLGIRTPKSILIHKHNSLETLKFIHDIGLPCILKYRYGSMSYHTVKIYNSKQFEEHISFMLNQDNGPVLCEEYIQGKELSVPVIGTAPNEQILSIIEYTDTTNNPLEIYDSFWKGENDAQVELNVLKTSTSSINEIVNSVHKLCKFLMFKDYVRFDFRLDYREHPYLLEGNPLPALACESAFDPASYGKNISFETVLSKIVESAVERYSLSDANLTY